MNLFRTIRLAALLVFGAAVVSHAHAAVLANDTRLVSASTALASAAKSGAFTVSSAGSYRLTISDNQIPTPSTLTNVSAVVTLGSTVIAQLDQTGSGKTTTKDFTAQPGDYKVFAIGKASDAAQAKISVKQVGANTDSYGDTVDILAPTPPPSNTTDLQTSIHVFAAGTYTLTFKDQAFPAALQDYDLILVNRANPQSNWQLCFQPTPACATPSTTFQFTVNEEGDYDLLVTAVAAGSDEAGLFSITVDGGPAAVTNGATTYRVGKMPEPAVIALPSGSVDSLALADLNFPTALSGMLHTALVQGDKVLVQTSQLGTAPITNAQQGSAQLYSLATASGTATYSRQVRQGTQTVYGDIRTTAATSYSFPTTIAATGTFAVQLKDFNFPSPLTSLQAVISQSGTSRTTMTATGTSDVQLNAGTADILVIPQAAADGNSLFGVSISTKGSGAKVLEVTQGIGQLFDAKTFTVTDAGSYDVSLADLKFPAAFGELAVALTRGPTLVGQIFGGGKFSFNATAGDYTLNFIAKAGGTPAEYGLYTMTVASTPPAPVVTLSASPMSVAAQGTTALTWSATNADSCTASGAWSGTKATSGTITSSALSIDSTFTLTCSGPGGSSNASTTVTIAAKSGGGGGGGSVSLDLLLLLALLSMAAHSRSYAQRRDS
jgi:hypothetical protein